MEMNFAPLGPRWNSGENNGMMMKIRNSIKESPLYPIANPKSIAFFGASNNFTAMGTSLLLSLKAIGFEGAIYPVHPKEDLVQGLKAYRSVRDLPEIPDLNSSKLSSFLHPRHPGCVRIRH